MRLLLYLYVTIPELNYLRGKADLMSLRKLAVQPKRDALIEYLSG
jgi:hypothetical protein